MKTLIRSLALVCALAAPAFAAGTWHQYIPRSKFHPMVGSSCTSAQLSGGGGIGSYNKDVLDCPYNNAQAFFGIEYWFPTNNVGNTIGVRLWGESDFVESANWCNHVSYLVSINASGSHWSSNDGQLGTTETVAGSAILTGGVEQPFTWPNNGTSGAATVVAHQQNGGDCTNATPSNCAGSPGIIFVRRGLVGTEGACGAGPDIVHTIHYIGADISGTWP